MATGCIVLAGATMAGTSAAALSQTSSSDTSTSQHVGGAGGEQRVRAYVTGYTFYDNTPAGTAIVSHPVLHEQAGGSGTYVDPITVAVGHRLDDGQDILDWPAGTRIYVPDLARYFVVEDTCGDGAAPQHGPCHSLVEAPDGVTTWVDVWTGGQRAGPDAARACTERVTAARDIIVGARDGYPVSGAGDLADACPG